MVALAAAAALKGEDGWAARVLGAADAVTERTGATVVDKSVQTIRDQAEAGDQGSRRARSMDARSEAAGR